MALLLQPLCFSIIFVPKTFVVPNFPTPMQGVKIILNGCPDLGWIKSIDEHFKFLFSVLIHKTLQGRKFRLLVKICN